MDTSYINKWAYVKSLPLLPKEGISIFPGEVEQLCFSTGPGKKHTTVSQATKRVTKHLITTGHAKLERPKK